MNTIRKKNKSEAISLDLRWAKHAYLQDLPLIGHALANELPVLKLWVTGLGRGVRLNLT